MSRREYNERVRRLKRLDLARRNHDDLPDSHNLWILRTLDSTSTFVQRCASIMIYRDSLGHVSNVKHAQTERCTRVLSAQLSKVCVYTVTIY